MKRARPGLAGLLPVLALAACGGNGTRGVPQTVAHVELQRYQGLWYEVAKIPNHFQDQCAADTSAEYRVRGDGRLAVTNRCKTDSGAWDEAQGVARVIDAASNARLKVSFVKLLGWQLFWGDYWVLDLAPDYSYVVVGTPSRAYGWILSRTPILPAATREKIDRRLREQGYDPQRFQASAHSP